MPLISHEKISRSITKAITFRSLILISDGIIILAITHRFDLAVGVIFFSNIASTALYFIHERIWNQIHWGEQVKSIKPDEKKDQNKILSSVLSTSLLINEQKPQAPKNFID